MKGGSCTLGRVMDWRQRKRESDREGDIDTEREEREREREKAGGLFCCEHSESPAGGAALTICQRRHAYFSEAARLLTAVATAVTSTRITKPRDKGFRLTLSLLTLLIYPACLWLLPPCSSTPPSTGFHSFFPPPLTSSNPVFPFYRFKIKHDLILSLLCVNFMPITPAV